MVFNSTINNFFVIDDITFYEHYLVKFVIYLTLLSWLSLTEHEKTISNSTLRIGLISRVLNFLLLSNKVQRQQRCLNTKHSLMDYTHTTHSPCFYLTCY